MQQPEGAEELLLRYTLKLLSSEQRRMVRTVSYCLSTLAC